MTMTQPNPTTHSARAGDTGPAPTTGGEPDRTAAGGGGTRVAGAVARVIAAKLARAVLVVLAAYSASFFLLFVLPGDAVLARIGTTDTIGSADVADLDLDLLRDEVGLSDNLWSQYLTGLSGLVRGDLGSSLITEQPVTTMLAEVLPNTVTLAAVSLAFSVPLGFLLAVLAVLPRSRAVRSLASLLPSAYVSLPVFWVGILLVYLFSITLGWFPSNGSQGVASLVLPVTVLAMLGSAQFAQVLISSLRTELDTTYASVTAPAKGASRFHTLYRHCLRNASFPLLAVFGLRIGQLLGGTVVVEMVFSRVGLGRLMVDSVKAVDLTVVLGLVVVLSVVYVVINILVDIGYVLLDPRLRRRPVNATSQEVDT